MSKVHAKVIHLVNHSTNPDVAAALPAMQVALQEQLHDACHAWVRPIWHVSLHGGDYELALFDDADTAGALGYHDETPAGLPYGKVFVNTTLQNGGTVSSSELSVSSVASHEMLEMLGDISVNEWAMDAQGVLWAWELCDAVESNSYQATNGVWVSNYLYPDYFDPQAPVGARLDELSVLHRPFEIATGGYAIKLENGKISQVFGEGYPEWKLAGKQHPAARTARRAAQTLANPGASIAAVA